MSSNRVISTFGGAFIAAALTLPSSAAEELLYDIINVQNAQGMTSHIALFQNEDVEAFIETHPMGEFDQLFRGVNYPLKDYLYQDLQTKGFSEDAAFSIAVRVSKAYHGTQGYVPDSPTPFYFSHDQSHGPNASPLDGNAQGYAPGKDAKVSTFCSVLYLSDRYDAATWTTSFLQLEDAAHMVYLGHDYSAEFELFTKYHEIAHCMGADEPMADYIATRMILENHENPEIAVGFARIIQSIRTADTLLRFNRDNLPYIGTPLAIAKAVSDYNPGQRVSDEEIWSLAVKRLNQTDYERDVVLYAAMIKKYQEDLTRSDQYGRTADYLEYTFALTAPSPALNSVMQDLRHLSQIVPSMRPSFALVEDTPQFFWSP